MTEIVSLVASGVGKLIGLIEVWAGAGAEQRAEIEAKAKKLVDGLDALFDAADAKDAAGMADLQAKIDADHRLPRELHAPNPAANEAAARDLGKPDGSGE
mgnify:CR=1 FL=1